MLALTGCCSDITDLNAFCFRSPEHIYTTGLNRVFGICCRGTICHSALTDSDRIGILLKKDERIYAVAVKASFSMVAAMNIL